jgi:molybdate transport system substrate-binding protein
MDDVESAGELDKGTRVDLPANRLVLVAPVDRAFEARIARDFDLAQSLPQISRIAVGDPAHVPAGRYVRQALEGWDGGPRLNRG